MRWALFLLLFSGVLHAEPIDLSVNHMPQTQNQLIMDSTRLAGYVAQAASVGLEYDKVYSYREYAAASRAAGIGLAGHYEFLLLSTGGSENNSADAARAIKSPLYWEMSYFDNINMTIIRAVKSDGSSSSVKLLKLAKGRVPDLHLK